LGTDGECARQYPSFITKVERQCSPFFLVPWQRLTGAWEYPVIVAANPSSAINIKVRIIEHR
jgi:hypothetical protein